MRRHLKRGVVLAVTGVGLYVVFPSVLAVLDAWPSLGDVRPWWFVMVAVLQVSSFGCLWLLLRIALRTGHWWPVVGSQLASNGASRVLPGGAVSGGVVQASMLIQAGHRPAAVAGALGSTGLLTTGMLLALPVLVVPAVVAGLPLNHQVRLGLVASLILVVGLVAVGFAVLKWDRVIHATARAAGISLAAVWRRADAHAVADRIVGERDRVAASFSRRWIRALSAAAGNRVLDYATLLAAVHAIGGELRPGLVLLAYVAAAALAMVPITPGGLGVVETGLTAMLVLVGLPSQQALVATLLYRLASYWLPILLGGAAWVVWQLHRRGAPDRSSPRSGDSPAAGGS